MRRGLPALVLALLMLPLVPVSADHVPITYDAAAAAGLFPTPNEVQAAIDDAVGHPWVTIHTVGSSLDGIPLRVLAITDPDSGVPMEDRVITFLMTQQHGNEPAGTPAALQLLDEILTGEPVADFLANQVLLLMPMANPDGALDSRRTNENGTDINRDHVALETPEGQAIHAVLNAWDVHVAIDHHEYGGTGIGYPSPVRFYDYDITTMYPRHGNVRSPTMDQTLKLNYEHIYPRAEEAGFTIGDYGVQTVAGIPVRQVAGGPDPGILRNSFGLNNIVGILVESFVGFSPLPFHDAQRRIAAQHLTMVATLEYAHHNGLDLIQAKRESERLNLEEPLESYFEDEAHTGPLPEAYQLPHDAALDALFVLHGLPAAIVNDEGHPIQPLHHARAGLVAAILDPHSSRAVTDGVKAVAWNGTNVHENEPLEPRQKESPGVVVPLALAVLAGVGLVWNRRRIA